MNNLKVLTNGIFKENPTFALLLGMCPTLGVTTSAINGMGMGLATAFVLVMSNLVISLVTNIIPDPYSFLYCHHCSFRNCSGYVYGRLSAFTA